MKIIDFFMKKLFHVSISEKQETLKIAKKMATLTNGFQQQQAASRQQKALMNNNIELQFKKTFESDRIAMSFYDKDGYLIELNNCMRQLCGFDAEGEKFFRETRMFDVPVFHANLGSFASAAWPSASSERSSPESMSETRYADSSENTLSPSTAVPPRAMTA